MPSQTVNSGKTTFKIEGYILGQSTIGAFYNFGKLILYRDGELDKSLIFQAGLIVGAEIFEAYLLGSLAQSSGVSDFSARFIKVQLASLVLNCAKEGLYSSCVTQLAGPNAYRNFLELWRRGNPQTQTPPVLDEKYGKLLSNFYTESSAGTYQFGNVVRGILSSASKLVISLWNLFMGSTYEFLAIGAYILATATASFFLNKKLFSLFKEVKTLDSELKLIPVTTTKSIDRVVEEFKDSINKQQASENKMQKLKVAIFAITIVQDILSVRRGVQHLGKVFSTNQNSSASESANLKFNEGTTFISWVNANAFRIVDALHRITATNKVLQALFSFWDAENANAQRQRPAAGAANSSALAAATSASAQGQAPAQQLRRRDANGKMTDVPQVRKHKKDTRSSARGISATVRQVGGQDSPCLGALNSALLKQCGSSASSIATGEASTETSDSCTSKRNVGRHAAAVAKERNGSVERNQGVSEGNTHVASLHDSRSSSTKGIAA
jgi:hypothetical protein